MEKIDNCSLPIANCILTIAGHDPSGGAGLSSDIKTFEAHGLYGLSVCTAITVQNDNTFKSCKWVDLKLILDQITVLFERFTINVVKIGIVENWKVLYLITQFLKEKNTEIKIILDPVLRASSDYDFHKDDISLAFEKALENCYLVTPNYIEIEALFPSKSISETIDFISNKTNLYLKGGHRKDKKGYDELYYNKIVQVNMKPGHLTVFPKHGSGCVLSSSISSNIALGHPIEDACRLSKRYIEQFLSSNQTLLGTHFKNSEVKNSGVKSWEITN